MVQGVHHQLTAGSPAHCAAVCAVDFVRVVAREASARIVVLVDSAFWLGQRVSGCPAGSDSNFTG